MVSVTEAYQPSGGFYIEDKDSFLENHSLYQEDGFIYVLPPDESIDIDYKYQMEIAKCVYKRNVCSEITDVVGRDVEMSKLVEIIGPDDKVHYRRPAGHPDIAEAERTPGYSVKYDS